MPDLLTNVIEDTISEEAVVTSSILLTITGTIPQGRVRITGDIGGGEATLLTYSAGDPIHFYYLPITAGTTIKAYLEKTGGANGIDVTVTYLCAACEEDFCYLIDDSSNFLIDDEGNFLVAPCS